MGRRLQDGDRTKGYICPACGDTERIVYVQVTRPGREWCWTVCASCERRFSSWSRNKV